MIMLICMTLFSSTAENQHNDNRLTDLSEPNPQLSEMVLREIVLLVSQNGMTLDSWPESAKKNLVTTLLQNENPFDEFADKLLSDGSVSDSVRVVQISEALSSRYLDMAAVIYSIAEAGWGRYLRDWTAEQYIWFQGLLNENNIRIANPSIEFLIPKEGFDINKEEAIAIASAYIDQESTVFDKSISDYTLEQCFFCRLDDGHPGWVLSFYGDDDSQFDTNGFYIEIYAGGRIAQIQKPMLKKPIIDSFNSLIREKGAFVTWSIEDKYHFSLSYREKYETYLREHPEKQEEMTKTYLHYLLLNNYQLLRDSDISIDEAIRKAVKSVREKYHLSVNSIESDYMFYSSVLNNEQSLRMIRIFMAPKVTIGTERGYRADFNAINGELISIINQDANDSLFSTYYE